MWCWNELQTLRRAQGFGLPQWIQGSGVVPRLCMLGMSAGTLFMAVGWIQIIAGELVGCLQVCSQLTGMRAVLLAFLRAWRFYCATSLFHVQGSQGRFAPCSPFSEEQLRFFSHRGDMLVRNISVHPNPCLTVR